MQIDAWVVLVLFAMQLGAGVGLFLWLLKRDAAKSAGAETRLMMIAESAMAHIKASSLDEKVRVEQAKQEYDFRVQYLRDTMTKEAFQENAKREKPKRIVKTDVGAEIDLNDYEILS